MTLDARFIERYNVKRQVQLCQHDENVGTMDAAALLVLGFATDDVEGFFLSELGIAYDETNSSHVGVAVKGVELTLRTWAQGATSEDEERLESWKRNRLQRIKPALLPKTSSELTPSDENPTNTTVRPRFDRRDMPDFVPGNRSAQWPNND